MQTFRRRWCHLHAKNSASNLFSPAWTKEKNPNSVMSQPSSLPFRSILQRQSFKLTSGLHRFPELDHFQLADVMQWNLWGFQLAFTNLTVSLRQEKKKKSASKFWFKYCHLTKYPESGDILGFRSEPYLKSDFRHFHRKRKYLRILGGKRIF